MIGRQSPDYWHAHAQFSLASDGDPEVLETVCANLQARPGVERVAHDPGMLEIDYDIREITREEIVAEFREPGLLAPLRWWQGLAEQLAQHREAVRRMEQSMEYGWDGWIREIYVSRYKHRHHGRRDDRLKHWRQYMKDDSSADEQAPS